MYEVLASWWCTLALYHVRDEVGRLQVRTFLRWWETLGRPERIVAMSLATGGVVAITNSTVWAAATCYMARQKALVALRAADARGDANNSLGTTVANEREAMSARDAALSSMTGHQS